MKVGLYFGSFNPIHVGHCIIASLVQQELSLDQVWLIVSPQNPHKAAAALLNEYHRLHLVKLALEGQAKIKASDIEFNLPKPSYTIDTMTYLEEKYPEYDFFIIIGSDSFQNLHKWKNAAVLTTRFKFIVYKRPNFEIANKSLKINYLEISAPLLEISSTQIRAMIKEGKSIRYLVPDKVMEEIDLYKYYRS